MQLQTGTGIGVRRLQARNLEQCSNTGQQPHEAEHQNLVGLGIDPSQTHRLFVGTDANEITTEHGAGQHRLSNEYDQQSDDERRGNAEGDRVG
ncbi:hypothetical protein D3C85_1560110 [compost metagenome]